MSKSVSLSCAGITLLSMMAASLSFAQPAAPSPPGTVPVALGCRDFHRNADGTWSPNRPIDIGGVPLSPSVGYKKGQIFGGIPLADALEESCVRPSK